MLRSAGKTISKQMFRIVSSLVKKTITLYQIISARKVFIMDLYELTGIRYFQDCKFTSKVAIFDCGVEKYN